MSEKIDETLRKLAKGMQTGKTDQDREMNQETSKYSHGMPGDPDCPKCHGLGYTRLDLPVGHPEFGKVHLCDCRKEEISHHVHDRLYAMSNLDALQHLSFENFESRGRVGLWPAEADSLERAFNHAQRYSQSLEGWLLLQGGYGCGKTHLAAAIANFTVSMGVPTLFITVPDLLDSLRTSYQSQETTFEKRFEEIRTAPLLILDDFGTQNATQWAQEKLFQIINYRYISRLPTVVTTNLSLVDLEERIHSRLLDPELVTKVNILATDYRNPTGDIGHHEISSLPMMHQMTFDNFEMRPGEGLSSKQINSLKRAHDSALDFANNPEGWLVLTGGYMCGKTHLAAAIANNIAHQGSPPQVISVPKLLDYLRATFNANSGVTLDRRFEEICAAPILILDDLGSQSSTPWVKEKLFQLFNYRYLAKLPTVITTTEWKEEMDPRLRSRIEDKRLCKIIGITAPAYRG